MPWGRPPATRHWARTLLFVALLLYGACAPGCAGCSCSACNCSNGGGCYPQYNSSCAFTGFGDFDGAPVNLCAEGRGVCGAACGSYSFPSADPQCARGESCCVPCGCESCNAEGGCATPEFDAGFPPDGGTESVGPLEVGVFDVPQTGTCNSMPCMPGCTCEEGSDDASDGGGGGMVGVCTCETDGGSDGSSGEGGTGGDAGTDAPADAPREATLDGSRDAPSDGPRDARSEGAVDGPGDGPADAGPDALDAGGLYACGVIYCLEPCSCLSTSLSECWCP